MMGYLMDSVGLDRDTHVKVSHHGVPGHSRLLDEGVGIDAIIKDFSKAFDLVPHDRLLMKLAASGVDSRVVI